MFPIEFILSVKAPPAKFEQFPLVNLIFTCPENVAVHVILAPDAPDADTDGVRLSFEIASNTVKFSLVANTFPTEKV